MISLEILSSKKMWQKQDDDGTIVQQNAPRPILKLKTLANAKPSENNRSPLLYYQLG